MKILWLLDKEHNKNLIVKPTWLSFGWVFMINPYASLYYNLDTNINDEWLIMYGKYLLYFTSWIDSINEQWQITVSLIPNDNSDVISYGRFLWSSTNTIVSQYLDWDKFIFNHYDNDGYGDYAVREELNLLTWSWSHLTWHAGWISITNWNIEFMGYTCIWNMIVLWSSWNYYYHPYIKFTK